MKDLTAAIKRIETSRQTHVDWRDYWLSTPGHEDCESCKATAAIAGDLDRQVRVIAEYDNVLACLREAESAEAAHEAEKAAHEEAEQHIVQLTESRDRAEAAHERLRAEVGALADEWGSTPWDQTPHLGCLDMYRHCAGILTTLLGGGEAR